MRVLLLLLSAIAWAQSPPNGADRMSPAVVSPPSYTPMTEKERLRQYMKDVVSPVSFLTSAASAGIGQWRESPREWREGARGYGLRYASSFGEHIVKESLVLGLASAMKEDDRFVPSLRSGIGARTKYAVAEAFLARRSDGSKRLSFSKIGACAGAVLLSRLWQPPSLRNARSAEINFGTSIAAGVGMDVAREFWPRGR
jgi:hypothetical protein